MKTPKQFWSESRTKVPINDDPFNMWLEKCLVWTIQQWLTQKRCEHKDDVVTQIDDQGCPYQHLIENPVGKFINECLEELK